MNIPDQYDNTSGNRSVRRARESRCTTPSALPSCQEGSPRRGGVVMKPLCAAIMMAFAVGRVTPAIANPTGGVVVNGSATFATTNGGSTLTITNSPSAIINWNSFSIGATETTHFNQTGGVTSSVMNRVTGGNVSSILGTLSSNGRVFLINPSGVVFGAGSTIDVAGMVASTLNISNANFLAGRMQFDAVPGYAPANVTNNGTITTANELPPTSPDGGRVILLASGDVTNNGIITSPGGIVLLASGSKVFLADSAATGVVVEVTGATGNATNLGSIVADSGRIGIIGAMVRNAGILQANSAVADKDGRIFLSARSNDPKSGNVTLDDGSIISAVNSGNASATNFAPGEVEIEASGSIVQTSASNVSLTADNAFLSAAGSIGDATTVINTTVTSLDLSAGTDIYLANSKNLQHLGISVTPGMNDVQTYSITAPNLINFSVTEETGYGGAALGNIMVNNITTTNDGLDLYITNNNPGAGNITIGTVFIDSSVAGKPSRAQFEARTGSIFDDNLQNTGISAGYVGLYAGQSVGGYGGADIDIINTQNPHLLASAGNGNIYVTAANGAILDNIETPGNGGEIVITATTGDITVGNVNANVYNFAGGGGNVTLNAAAGSILDDLDQTTGITANVLTLLDAVTGPPKSIGNGTLNGDALIGDIDTNVNTLNATAGDGGLFLTEADGIFLNNVTSGGNINLTATQGDIYVGSVSAEGKTINLTANNGAILEGGGNLLRAATLNLNARNGIGSSSSGSITRLEIGNNPNVNVVASGSVYLDGVMNLASINISGENSNLRVTGSGLTIGNISISSGFADLDAGEGDLLDDNIQTTKITAGQITLRSFGHVGNTASNANGDIDTATASLSISAGGNIAVSNTGDLSALHVEVDADSTYSITSNNLTFNVSKNVVSKGPSSFSFNLDVNNVTDDTGLDFELVNRSHSIRLGTVNVGGATGKLGSAVFVSNNGSITSINNGGIHVTAGHVGLFAANGSVGNSDGAIKTATPSLEVAAGTLVYVANTGDLNKLHLALNPGTAGTQTYSITANNLAFSVSEEVVTGSGGPVPTGNLVVGNVSDTTGLDLQLTLNGSGNIILNNVNVTGGVATAGSAVFQTFGGAIVDAPDTNTYITAGHVGLIAPGGSVGSTAGYGGDIDTTATSLFVQSGNNIAVANTLDLNDLHVVVNPSSANLQTYSISANTGVTDTLAFNVTEDVDGQGNGIGSIHVNGLTDTTGLNLTLTAVNAADITLQGAFNVGTGAVTLAAGRDLYIHSALNYGNTNNNGDLTLAAGGDVLLNASIGTDISRFNHNVKLIAGDEILVNADIYLGNAGATTKANLDLHASASFSTPGLDIYGYGSGGVHIENPGYGFNAPRNVNVLGNLNISGHHVNIQAGSAAEGGNLTVDRSVHVAAGGNIDIFADSGITVAAGTATANATANANATITNTAHADVNLNAGGNLSLNAGGDINLGGGNAQATATNGIINLSGQNFTATNTATATATTTVTAVGKMDIVSGNTLAINTNAAKATATNLITANAAVTANNNVITATNIASANANVSISAGGNQSLTANTGINVDGGFGGAVLAGNLITARGTDALNKATADNNTITGLNNATATAAITISAGQAQKLKVNNSTGGITIAAGRANAGEISSASGIPELLRGAGNGMVAKFGNVTNNKIGTDSLNRADNIAGVTTGITLNAGTTSELNAGTITLYVSGNGLGADALVVSGVKTYAEGNIATGNKIYGNNTVTANNTSSIKAAGNITLAATLYDLNMYGGVANARDTSRIEGSNNIASGSNNVTATASLNLATTGGNVMLTGNNSIGITVGIPRAYTSASISGINNTISVEQTTQADAMLTIGGNNITLSTQTGGVVFNGNNAQAQSQINLSGDSHTAAAARSATATNGILVNASGTLSITAAGGISVSGNGATATQTLSLTGNNHTVSGALHASADHSVTLAGANVSLSAAGSQGINQTAATVSANNNNNTSIVLPAPTATAVHKITAGVGSTGNVIATANNFYNANNVATGGNISLLGAVTAGNNITAIAGADAGDITAGNLSANNTITLTAPGGSIYNDSNLDTRITAPTVNLTATDIGVYYGALDTAVGTLNATATGGAYGSIYLNELDAITLDQISGGDFVVIGNTTGDMTVNRVTSNGIVSLTASGGNILDGNTATTTVDGKTTENPNIISTTLNLTAANGIGDNTAAGDFDTAAGILNASVTGYGGGSIYITEIDDVAIGYGGLHTNGGEIKLNVAGNLTTAGYGSIETVVTGAAVTGNGGNITLTVSGAGNSINLTGTIDASGAYGTGGNGGNILITTENGSITVANVYANGGRGASGAYGTSGASGGGIGGIGGIGGAGGIGGNITITATGAGNFVTAGSLQAYGGAGGWGGNGGSGASGTVAAGGDGGKGGIGGAGGTVLITTTDGAITVARASTYGGTGGRGGVGGNGGLGGNGTLGGIGGNVTLRVTNADAADRHITVNNGINTAGGAGGGGGSGGNGGNGAAGANAGHILLEVKDTDLTLGTGNISVTGSLNANGGGAGYAGGGASYGFNGSGGGDGGNVTLTALGNGTVTTNHISANGGGGGSGIGGDGGNVLITTDDGSITVNSSIYTYGASGQAGGGKGGDVTLRVEDADDVGRNITVANGSVIYAWGGGGGGNGIGGDGGNVTLEVLDAGDVTDVAGAGSVMLTGAIYTNGGGANNSGNAGGNGGNITLTASGNGTVTTNYIHAIGGGGGGIMGGGDGGDVLITTENGSITANSSIVTNGGYGQTGGIGGNGGAGGMGGNITLSAHGAGREVLVTGSLSAYGGAGGSGGGGATGITGSTGGNGGNGGAGGAGGTVLVTTDDGNITVSSVNAYGGYGGRGGNGGFGSGTTGQNGIGGLGGNGALGGLGGNINLTITAPTVTGRDITVSGALQTYGGAGGGGGSGGYGGTNGTYGNGGNGAAGNDGGTIIVEAGSPAIGGNVTLLSSANANGGNAGAAGYGTIYGLAGNGGGDGGNITLTALGADGTINAPNYYMQAQGGYGGIGAGGDGGIVALTTQDGGITLYGALVQGGNGQNGGGKGGDVTLRVEDADAVGRDITFNGGVIYAYGGGGGDGVGLGGSGGNVTLEVLNADGVAGAGNVTVTNGVNTYGFDGNTGGGNGGNVTLTALGTGTVSVTSISATGGGALVSGNGGDGGSVSITTGASVDLNFAVSVYGGAATGGGNGGVGGNISVTANGATSDIIATNLLKATGGSGAIAGAGGIVTLNAGRNILDGNGVDWNVEAATLNATAGTHIGSNGTVTDALETTVVGAALAAIGDVHIAETDALDLAASTIGGNFTLTTAGAISDSGNLSITGTTSLTAGATNSIVLNNSNDFGGAVTIVSGKDVTLNDINALDLGASTVGGNFIVTANGAISDSGNLSVTGSTNLTAGATNSIVLNNSNDFGGAVSIVSSNNVTLNDINALDLGASTVSGNLGVTAAGAITTSGAISFGGNATLAATGTSSDIIVSHNLTATGSANNTLTLQADNSIFFNSGADVNTTNALHVVLNADRDAGAAGYGGAISLGGNTVITSKGGDITLGGGADPTITAAVGTLANSVGVKLDNAQLLSGNGAISIRGQNASGASGLDGVVLIGGSVVQSTGGKITIEGKANNANGDVFGVWVTGTGTKITSTSGNISITGSHIGTATATAGNHGVVVSDAALIETTGSGNVSLTGTGAAGSDNNFGIQIGSGADVISSQTTTGAGTITLKGTGGAGSGDNNFGVYITDGGTSITSSIGNISITGNNTATGRSVGVLISNTANVTTSGIANIDITGTAATGSGSASYGVAILANAKVESTAATGDTTKGKITIIGNAGTAGVGSSDGGVLLGDGSFGVGATGSGGDVSSVDGAISITGSGNGTAAETYGVTLYQNSTVTSTGLASINIKGTGGTGSGGSNYGVWIFGNSDIISSGSGAITLTGTGQGTGSNNFGINISDSGTTITAATGDIALTGTGAAGAAGISIVNASVGSTTQTSDILLHSLAGTGINLNSATITTKAATAGSDVTLNLAGGGNATQTGGSIVASGLRLLSDTGGSFTLNAAGNDVAILAGNIAGNTSYTDASGVDIGALTTAPTAGGTATTSDGLTVGGNLALTANGAVSDSGNLAVTGTTSLTAGALNDIVLDKSNNFGGAVSVVSGNNVTLNDTGAIDLGASTVSGNLDATANAGNISTSGNISFGGNATLTAKGTSSDIIVSNTLTRSTSTADTTLTLRADNSIIFNNTNADVVTNGTGKQNVILNADRDASGAGAIALGSGTVITSNGGNITLGGGTDPTTTAAFGTATNIEGVKLDNAQLISGVGNITITGKGAGTAVANAQGVAIGGNTSLVQASSGNINIIGTGGAAATGGSIGFSLTSNATVQSTTTGNITITGTNVSGASSNNQGVLISNGKILTDASGNIAITGTSAEAAASAIHAGLSGTTNIIGGATATGNILLHATGGTSPDIALGAGTTIQTTGAVTLNAGAGVAQTNGTGAILAGSLRLLGTGTFSLANTSNDIGTLAGNVTGSVSFVDANSFALGAVTSAPTAGGAATTSTGLTASTTVNLIATAGAITDGIAGEGAGFENVSGTVVTLTASTGIGTALDDINTAATELDLTTGSGGITIAETNAVQLGNATGGINTTTSGDIVVVAGGAITTGNSTTTAGGGNISISNTAGAITLSNAVTANGAGNVTLNAAALLTANAAISSTSGNLSLTGVGVTSTAAGTANAGSGTILVDANDGAISLAGTLTTTNATATAVRIIDATTASLGSITATAGTVTLGGATTDNLSGAVTQSGATIIKAATLTGNAGSTVTLGVNANEIGSLAAFTSNGAFALNDATGGLNVTGAVFNSNIGLASITTSGGALAVTSTGSVAGANVSLTTTGANDITLAGNLVSGTGGTITLVSGGAISQSAGGIFADSTTSLTAGSTNDIVLDKSNNFGGAVSIVSGNNVTLNDTGALDLGASTVSGNLIVTANGAVSDSGNLAITGTTSLTAGALNDITLNNSNNFGGAVSIVSGNNVTLNDTGAIDLGASTVSGNFVITANGAVSDSGNLSITGATSLTAGAGNDIVLDKSNNFGGAVSIVSANNVSLNDINTLDLGASTVSGNLTITANGAVSDSGNLAITGTTSLTAGALNDIILDKSNNFGGAVSIVSANNVTLNDINTLDLGASTVSGNLTLTANGAVTTSGAISFGGNATLTATGAASDVIVSHNLTGSGSAGNTLTLRADNNVAFNSGADVGSTNALHIVLNSDRDADTAGGGGAIHIGADSVIASTGGNITLGGGTDPATAAAKGNASLKNGVLINGTLDAAGSATGGNIQIRGDSDLNAINGTLDVHGVAIRDGGNVSTAGGGNIDITGNALRGGEHAWGTAVIYGGTVSAVDGDITLNGAGGDGANAIGVVVHWNAKVGATGTGDIFMIGTAGTGTNSSRGVAVVSVGANLAEVSTNSGNISLQGTSNGTGADDFGTHITGGNGGVVSISGDIALTGTGGTGSAGNGVVANLQASGISLIGGGTSGDILIHGLSGTGITLTSANIATTGNLTLRAQGGGNVAQTDGVITAGGLRLLNDTGGNFTLSSASNDVATLAGNIAGSLSYTDASGVAIGAVTSVAAAGNAATTTTGLTTSGNFSLSASGDITQTTGATLKVSGTSIINAGSGNITLTNSTNNFTGALTLSGGNTQIAQAGTTVLATVTTSGNLGFTSGGGISQSGTIVVAGTLALDAGGSIILTDAKNDFGSVNIVNAANVTLVDVNGIDLAATTVSGSLDITAGGGITQSAAVSVGGTATLSATDPKSGNPADIVLDNAGNNFGTVVITSGNNVTLADSNTIALGASTVSGTLTVNSNGITQSGAITTANANLNGGNGAIALNNTGNDFTGTVSVANNANNVTLVDKNSIVLGDAKLLNGGVLSVTAANGAITQAANTMLSAAAATLNATGGINVVTAVASISSSNTVSGNTVISNSGALSVGNISDSGKVTLTNNAALTQSGGTAVTALDLLAQAAGGIVLNTTVTTLATSDTGIGNTTITNSGAVTLTSASVNSGSFTLNNTGNATIDGSVDAAGVSLHAGGAAANLTFTGKSNVASTAASNLTAAQDVIVNGGQASSAGDTTLTVGRDLSIDQGGKIEAIGTPAAGTTPAVGSSVHGTIGGNVNITGGTTAASVLSGSLDIGSEASPLNVGGEIYLNDGPDVGGVPTGAGAIFKANSPNSIWIRFVNPDTTIGYTVNGVPQAITNGNSGFFVDGSPGQLGVNFHANVASIATSTEVISNLVNDIIIEPTDTGGDTTTEQEKKKEEVVAEGDGGGDPTGDPAQQMPVCK